MTEEELALGSERMLDPLQPGDRVRYAKHTLARQHGEGVFLCAAVPLAVQGDVLVDWGYGGRYTYERDLERVP